MKKLLLFSLLISKTFSSTIITKADYLNLRLEPNTASRILKQFPINTLLTSLELKKGDFVLVKEIGSKVEGWVHKKYIRSYDSSAESIVTEAQKYLNVKYIWGGTSPKGFDCSGFIKYTLEHSLGISNFPRVSYNQAEYRQEKIDLNNIQRGDILFFDTAGEGHVNHCAIYLGNNQFIHATSAKHLKKVTITKLKPFYKRNFKWAIRVI